MSNDSFGDPESYGYPLEAGVNVTVYNSTDLLPATTHSPAILPPSFSALQLLIRRMTWVVLVVLTPSISAIGIAGNILSIIVISQDGFRKSSNILLIALAMSDTTVLVGNSVDTMFAAHFSRALSYGELTNRFLFHIFAIFGKSLLTLGILCSYSFPMLITVERLCAIFFPLKFHLIITPARTLTAVLLVLATYAAYAIFYGLSIKLGEPVQYRGKVYMVIQPSRMYFRYSELYMMLSRVLNEMTGTVPIVVLVLGSLVIGYKVKTAARRRARMMSQGDPEKGRKNSASQSRTTKTLLAVCITFVVLNGFCYIYDLVQKEDLLLDYHVNKFFFHVNTMVFCINCSCNFFIYILNNNKFRERLVTLFSRNQDSSRAPGKANVVYSEYSTKQ